MARQEGSPLGSDARGRTPRPLVWIGLVVTVAFGYLAVRDVDFATAADALQAAELWWLVPAFVAFALIVVFRAERWRALFPPETRPPFRPVLQAVLIGYFFNSILPARAGEVARVLALYRSTRVSRVQSGATAVLERAFDLVAILALFVAVSPWLPKVDWFRPAVVLAGAVVGALLLAALALALFGERPFLALVRPAARVTRLSVGRLEEAGRNLGRGLAGIRSGRVAVVGAAWTFAAWAVAALSNWFVMLGFDLDLSLLAALLVAVATAVGSVLPSSPASLGVWEAATVLALSAYGVDASLALSYGVVLHLLNFVPFLVAGPVALRRLR
jgi:uncharacterized protein (TIRG00374 family)